MAKPPDLIRKLVNSYRWPSSFREGMRELWRGRGENRGRERTITGEQATSTYIELEARAQILSNGQLVPMLRHPRLRLVNADGERTRLSPRDRTRLRKRYAIGKCEVLHWKNLRFHFGPPDTEPRRPEDGEPHPTYLEILRRLDDRIAELRSRPPGLFFITDL